MIKQRQSLWTFRKSYCRKLFNQIFRKDNICPDCAGHGISLAFCDYVDESKNGLEIIKCRRCAGNGYIPAIMKDWIEKGLQLRMLMHDNHWSFKDVSNLTGFGIVAVSDAKHGYSDPTPVLDALPGGIK